MPRKYGLAGKYPVTVSNKISTKIGDEEVKFVQNVQMNLDSQNLFELNEANNDGSKSNATSPTLTINVDKDNVYSVSFSEAVASQFEKQFKELGIDDDHLKAIIDDRKLQIDSNDSAISVESKNNEFIVTVKSKDGKEYTLVANSTGVKLDYGEHKFAYSLGKDKHLDVNMHRDFATSMLKQEKPFAEITAKEKQDRVRSIPHYIIYEYCQGFKNKDVNMQSPTTIGDFSFYRAQLDPDKQGSSITDYVFIKDEKTKQVFLYGNGGLNECKNYFFTQDKNGKLSLDINFRQGGKTTEIDCQNPKFKEFFHNFTQINLPQAGASDKAGNVFEKISTLEIDGQKYDVYHNNPTATLNTRFSYTQKKYEQESIISDENDDLEDDNLDPNEDEMDLNNDTDSSDRPR